MKKIHAQFLMAVTLLSLGAGLTHASEVTVRISGHSKPHGEIACALFNNEEGFPMKPGGLQYRVNPDSSSPVCKFKGLPAGLYAVSVAHDQNGNGMLDTNLLGIPQEQWGVSNNFRPRLRAPRYSEASFRVEPDQQVVIDIELSK